MRYGFFFGVGGELSALGGVLELLADCDRIISLGDLVGGSLEGDRACWERFASGGDRCLTLAGAGEKRRARDPSLDPAFRHELRGLSGATLEGGVAVLGSFSVQNARFADDGPRLVAPLAVVGHGGPSRLWRSAGGLARVEEIGAGAYVRLRQDRLRLELGRARQEDGRLRVAVIDDATGHLELRESRAPSMERQAEVLAPKRRLRRRKVDPRQYLLAV
ncbi:hypothetical protein [Vulgatibacter incomptus]|uniref:Uncharacterized protein n=1 Tax=Vulgatibacter incomptus TaxID=1391653 RepID=A0A0K1PI76_9BACT|nr:hypothetical protein [Vulgatibacter incomptus]AKU93238.1 hypothetical protein AKJ08_3625 [Vulgatibacter incomptus]